MDDLLIVSKSPPLILDALTNKHNLKLKGTGHISYHLGCGFFRDGNNEICLAHPKCIDKMLDSYASMFVSKPKSTYHSLSGNGDHP